jgi:hypothetical protein
MKAWIDGECGHCYGFGMVLPKVRPITEETELELCPSCRGYGRKPRTLSTRGFINAIVASELLREGAAYRVRSECQEFIEATY